MGRFFASLTLLTALIAPSMLLAQEEDEAFEEGIDEVEEAEQIVGPVEKQVAGEEQKLVDVVRGTYIQAMLTETKFVGLIGQTDTSGNPLQTVGDSSYWGVGVKLAVGRELIDNPSFGLGIEASYGQGAFNGTAYDPTNGRYSPLQGDFRGHLFQLSAKPTAIVSKSRRWSVAGKVTAGGFYSGASVAEVNQPVPGLHGSFHPAVGAGVGLEYYSKLSHFSVTLVETEFLYILGFDASLGVNFLGLKYTF